MDKEIDPRGSIFYAYLKFFTANSSPFLPAIADIARAAIRPRKVRTEPIETAFDALSAPFLAFSTVSSAVSFASLASSLILSLA